MVTYSDQNYIRCIGLAYDWLYPIMNQTQRSNALYAIQATCDWSMKAGNFWWNPTSTAYGWGVGDTNRIYPGPFQTLRFSASKIGSSHPWFNFAGCFTSALAAQGDGSIDVDTYWQMGLNYILAKGFPFGSSQGLNEGRLYSFQDSMDVTKQLWNIIAASVIYPEATLTNYPFYRTIADWWDRMIPVHFYEGHEPWGDCGWGRFSQWSDTQWGRDLSLFTGSGNAMLHYNNEFYLTYTANRYTPPLDPVDEVGIPPLFQAPQPTTNNSLAALYPNEGWVFSYSSPPNMPQFMENGVGFIFQARPRGSQMGHDHLSDGSFQIWAYGANVTDAGAQMTDYAKIPWCHYTLLVNGLGQCSPPTGPMEPFYSTITAYTNNSDFTYCAADLTRSYARSNFQAGGWLLPSPFTTLHSGGPLSYVTNVTRQILFEHKSYLVIYDTLQTSNPPTNTFSWIYHILQPTLSLNTNNMSFTYTATNMFNGNNVSVYVAFVNNPSELAVTNMTGTNVRSNPITGENYYTQGDAIIRSNALWFSNTQPTNSFHFMTVIYPVPPGGNPPQITRLDDDTVAVTNGSQGDVISFNPNTTFPATLVVAVPSVSAVAPPDLTPPTSVSQTTGNTGTVTPAAPAAPTNLRIPPNGTTSPVTNGLIGWWKFDSISGSTAVDSSGNGNTGTLMHFPAGNAFWESAVINNGLQFNGSNYVSLSTITVPSTFTVTYWVNPAGGAANYEFVLVSSATFNGAALYPATASTFNPTYFSGYSGYKAAGALPAGTWSFVAMTFNAGAVTFYINGNIPDANIYSGLTGMNPNQIGSPNASGDFLLGTLDNLKLFNRVLSPAEISQEYNCLNQ